jgi:predicted transposase/invertase (TIGR01784 family)
VEEIIKMDMAIQKAEEKLVYVASNKEALRAYQMREMALSDWASGINHARLEGRQEGRLESRLERQGEIASKMKKRGVPIDQIAEDTGLSVEDIAKL